MARILIIDDEDLARYTVLKMLNSSGHELAEAENGKEGLALHQENPFDLIITDLIMPDMEGVETIMALRRSGPTPKIIAVSGGGRSGSGDYLSMAKRLGADQVLPKPFSQDELLSTVHSCLPDSMV